ncbi:MBL fold metallo-hydrolase [Streptomyces sp. NPDC001795]|uniref:MBL fold metallo-hydrolase n=1 Tax=Streptomyces sp. NPDC001795 TaxID=3154525 RepID=UPI003328265D
MAEVAQAVGYRVGVAVAPYPVDVPLDDGTVLRPGDADWEVVRTPGHAPGHLALCQPDERLPVAGDEWL